MNKRWAQDEDLNLMKQETEQYRIHVYINDFLDLGFKGFFLSGVYDAGFEPDESLIEDKLTQLD